MATTFPAVLYNGSREMDTIFISYRREDASGHAGRLYDRLTARLGAERVFMDVEDVRPGQDFVRAIDETVARCEHLFVIIGPRWLDAMTGRTSPDDYVRREILAGLQQGKTVIPLLVSGATMPRADRLPSDLAELSRRNAVRIHDDRFDDDVERLLRSIGEATPPRERDPVLPGRRRWLAAVAAVPLAALAAWFHLGAPAAPSVSGEWLAEMRKPGQPQPYRIRLSLIESGNSLTGTVRYPTGDGVIQEGAVEGDTIAFSTSHIPQFASKPSVIRYSGSIERDGIRLTATDDAGVATGIARRIAPPS